MITKYTNKTKTESTFIEIIEAKSKNKIIASVKILWYVPVNLRTIL